MIAGMIAAAEVTVDGEAVPDTPTARLVSLRVASRLGLPAQCELSYTTAYGTAAEADRFGLGSAVTVRMVGDDADLFDGEITCCGVSYGPDGETLLRIRCYDPLHRLRKRQQLRVFTDVTAADLATELLGGEGLDVEADDDGPVFERVVQHRQTDFDLLAETAARAGCYPVVDGGTLRLLTLAGHGDPVPLELGVTLFEAAIEANLDRAATATTALGWDPRTAEPFTERADRPRSGADVPFTVDTDADLALVDQQARSAAEIAARAQADLDRHAAATVTLTGVARGTAALRAGSRVEVTGVSADLSGEYVLTEAVHTVDATGYLTTLSTQPPPAPPPAQAAAITLGVVTDVADPYRLGRVKVTLPAHGDADVGWLGVLCPGAGDGRGIVALPDRGDTVLVALPHGPEAGFVLGSLYGAVRPPDAGVHEGGVRRWSLRTGGGQSVVLDDVKRTLTLSNKSGSAVRLAPGKVTLHAAADLDITAPGRTITIKADAVEFVHTPGAGGDA